MNDPKILLLIQSLAKAARTVLIESSDDAWALDEAGQVFESALRQIKSSREGREMPERVFPTRGSLWILGLGWHAHVDILSALARLDGDFVFGPSPVPSNLSTPLLQAFVTASDEVGRPWPEGSDELSRRNGVIWRLRDLGLWERPKGSSTKHITCC